MAKSKSQKLDKAAATETKGAASARKSARPRSSRTATKSAKPASSKSMTKQSAQAVVDKYVGMDNPGNEPQELKDARAFLKGEK